MKGFVTLPELARRAGLKSTGGLRTQIERGVLRAVKVGRDWLVRDEDAEEYLTRHAGKRGRPRCEPTDSEE